MIYTTDPSNEQAERAVIGLIMLNPGIIERTMAWIQHPDVFYYNVNKQLWICILDLYKGNSGIDILTVTNRYRERFHSELSPTEVAKFQQDGLNAENIENYAKIVWQRYLEREVMRISTKIGNASKAGYDKLDDLLFQYQRYIEELQHLKPNKDRSIEKIINDAALSISSGANIIEFGRSYLDYAAGGITRGEYTALGGRPGNGKTTLMLNIVDALAEQKLKVMIFNREMTNAAAISKLMIINSKTLNMSNIRQKNLPNNLKDEILGLRALLQEKYNTVRMYDDIISLEETLREIKRYEPDVIIDDYIQLIKVNGKRAKEGRRFEIDEICNEYKWILKDVNASGILVSQLSRDIEKRIDPSPIMSDFSEGGTIEQGAELCMFVAYPYYFNPADSNPMQNEIIVKKARYGKIGSHMVGFLGDKCKFFRNITEAKDYAESI